MIREFIVNFWIYIFLNIPLYLLYNYGSNNSILHKILSCVNICFFCLIMMMGFYKINPLFIIFVPMILLIACPISYGIIEELSNEGISGIVTGGLPPSLKSSFVKIITLPFYYIIKAWKK